MKIPIDKTEDDAYCMTLKASIEINQNLTRF